MLADFPGVIPQNAVSGLRGRSLLRCSHQLSLTRSDPAKGA
jgi:hypothetical protein